MGPDNASGYAELIPGDPKRIITSGLPTDRECLVTKQIQGGTT
jgi:hypothetical protein